MSDIPSRISLREVGPRDGLQNEDPVPASAKIALIEIGRASCRERV